MDSAEKEEKRRPLIETTSPTTPMRVDQPPAAAYPAGEAGEGEGPPSRVQAPPAGEIGPPVERMPTRTPEAAAGPVETGRARAPEAGPLEVTYQSEKAAAEERRRAQQQQREQEEEREWRQREQEKREQEQWEEEEEQRPRRPAAAERVAAVASKVGRVVHRTAEVATDVGNAVADAASAAEVSRGKGALMSQMGCRPDPHSVHISGWDNVIQQTLPVKPYILQSLKFSVKTKSHKPKCQLGTFDSMACSSSIQIIAAWLPPLPSGPAQGPAARSARGCVQRDPGSRHQAVLQLRNPHARHPDCSAVQRSPGRLCAPLPGMCKCVNGCGQHSGLLHPCAG